jgi:2-oxoglutarate/2-oxoacid ferredoxin oxidoreductase subunit alpha
MSGINDFVIKFATVNGSGSASANGMFVRTLFRMGIPVSPKNIFPSNIQGLATWYEVRVSEKGYLGRRDGIDLMVAMNPQSYAEDLKAVVAGGWLLYDSSLQRNWARDDVTIIPVPIAEMCAKKWSDPRQRQLFKNMVYVGALSALLEMDMDVLKAVVSDQLKGKEKLVAANMAAIDLGRTYALENFSCPLPIKVRHAEGAKGKIMATGNEAAGLGAVYAGATVLGWYPITPSTSVAEGFEKHAKRLRIKDGKRLYAIVQAEDELAAIGIAIGGGWNGARAFTATSGPGISLMSEFLGLAYFAEVPVVLFNIQRGGPSTGMPTRTGQPDILSCAYASHGDTKHVLLFPSDPTECFAMGAEAFNLAERLQTPVIVMSDLDIGMNDWVCDPFAWDDSKVHDRGKVLTAEELESFKDRRGQPWGRYLDIDGDGIPYRTLPGTHPNMGSFFTRGTSHDEYARYTEDGTIHARIIDRIRRKFEVTGAKLVPKPEISIADPKGKIGVIYFGATRPGVLEGIDELAAAGFKLNTLRLKAFPFSSGVKAFCAAHEKIFVVEQNRDGQMRSLLMVEAGVPGEKLVPVLNYDGTPMTAKFVRDTILGHLRPAKQQAAE